MDWGTTHQVATSAAAEGLYEAHKQRFPTTSSAYVPSGALPASALLWIAIGGVVAVPSAALAGAILGGVTLVLAALMGLVIAVVAACGFVVCITVLIELGIVLGGALLTFGGMGFAAGWIVATMSGRLGKNRNAWAAAAIAVPAALVAVAIVAAIPQVAVLFVGPPDPGSDFAISTLVHTAAELGWMQITTIVVGAIIAMAAAGFYAFEEVGAQKFCEPCDEHMKDDTLNGTSFDVAAWAFERAHAGDIASIAAQLATQTGIDVAHQLFRCPKCGAGYLESTGHLRAEWLDSKGNKSDRHYEWLCFSMALAERDTRALAACIRPEPHR